MVYSMANKFVQEDLTVGTLKKKQPPGCPKPVYYHREVFREKINPEDRSKGKERGSGPSRVRTKDTYLGTADMILKAVREKPQPTVVHRKQFGLVCAALRICEKLKIAEAIDAVVSKRNQGHSVGTYIVVGILNKLTSPCSRAGIADWLNKTVLPKHMGVDLALFSSASFWDQFEKICPEKPLKARQQQVDEGKLAEAELFANDAVFRIEERIWQQVIDHYNVPLDVILYDTTNFYTYFDVTTPSWLCRPGRNKAYRHHLRQVGLALATTVDSGLPILHSLVRGNRHDAKLFPESLSLMGERLIRLGRGTEGITVVFDKGNNSKDNIKAVDGAHFHLVGTLVPSHHRDLAGRSLARYETTLVDGRLAHREERSIYGLPSSVVVVYNEKTARKQEHRFRKKLTALKAKVRETFRKKKAKGESKAAIEQAIRYLLRDSDVGHLLKVTVSGRRYKTLSCRLKRTAVRRKLRTFGKQLIFTDRTELTAEEIIALYEQRPAVEEDFRQIKDPHTIAWQPAYCWTDSKLRVYALICVLALLVLKIMVREARAHGLSMSWNMLKTELADLDEVIVVYLDLRSVRLITERSTIQQRLYDLFELEVYAPP